MGKTQSKPVSGAIPAEATTTTNAAQSAAADRDAANARKVKARKLAAALARTKNPMFRLTHAEGVELSTLPHQPQPTADSPTRAAERKRDGARLTSLDVTPYNAGSHPRTRHPIRSSRRNSAGVNASRPALHVVTHGRAAFDATPARRGSFLAGRSLGADRVGVTRAPDSPSAARFEKKFGVAPPRLPGSQPRPHLVAAPAPKEEPVAEPKNNRNKKAVAVSVVAAVSAAAAWVLGDGFTCGGAIDFNACESETSSTPSVPGNGTATATPSATASATSSATASPTPSVSVQLSVTPSATPSPTASSSPSAAPTATVTITPSSSASPSVSVTGTATVSPSGTITITGTTTPSPTSSASASATVTISPSGEVSVTTTPTASASASATASATASPSPSVTRTFSPTPSESGSPTATVTPSPSASPTASATPPPSGLVCGIDIDAATKAFITGDNPLLGNDFGFSLSGADCLASTDATDVRICAPYHFGMYGCATEITYGGTQLPMTVDAGGASICGDITVPMNEVHNVGIQVSNAADIFGVCGNRNALRITLDSASLAAPVVSDEAGFSVSSARRALLVQEPTSETMGSNAGKAALNAVAATVVSEVAGTVIDAALQNASDSIKDKAARAARAIGPVAVAVANDPSATGLAVGVIGSIPALVAKDSPRTSAACASVMMVGNVAYNCYQAYTTGDVTPVVQGVLNMGLASAAAFITKSAFSWMKSSVTKEAKAPDVRADVEAPFRVAKEAAQPPIAVKVEKGV